MGDGATEDARVSPAPRRARREPAAWLLMAAYLMLGLLVVSVLQGTRVVRVYNVPSRSMQQTLGVGDRILISGLPYLTRGPARGDVVVFSHGESWDDETLPPSANPVVTVARLFGDLTGIGLSSRVHTVKRVIGLPGDTVACCDAAGRVTVNGAPLDEPYRYRDLPFAPGTLDCTTTPRSSRCFLPVRVPEGRLLVMGDHRSNSADSVVACRGAGATADCARLVDERRVVGRVFAKAWPPGPITPG